MRNPLFAALGLFVVALGPGWAADKDLPLPTDQKFLVKVIACSVAEIKFADTALQRANSADVKQLGQHVKEDHNQCLKEFMDAAKDQKLAVVEGLDQEHRDIATRLGRLEGKSFDLEYVRGVIQRHEHAIQMCETQIKDGKDKEIVAMCREALPKLRAHLEEARKVEDKLKG